MMRVTIKNHGNSFDGKKGTVIHSWLESEMFDNDVYFIVKLDDSACALQVTHKEVCVLNEKDR